jgi:hypothetical protein
MIAYNLCSSETRLCCSLMVSSSSLAIRYDSCYLLAVCSVSLNLSLNSLECFWISDYRSYNLRLRLTVAIYFALVREDTSACNYSMSCASYCCCCLARASSRTCRFLSSWRVSTCCDYFFTSTIWREDYFGSLSCRLARSSRLLGPQR